MNNHLKFILLATICVLSLLQACQTPALLCASEGTSLAANLLLGAAGAELAYEATLLAGNGSYGRTDGQGTKARFFNPSSLQLLSNGDLLVLDRFNHVIRLLTPTGQVTTFWGHGERGNQDGDSRQARLNQPIALLRLVDGSLLIADAQNHSLRRLTPDGNLSTLAGLGAEDYKDGPTLKAGFNWPADLAADTAGNIYIADRFNHAIRKLTPAGMVETLAGQGEPGYEDGPGQEALFNQPMGLVMGPDQVLYVSDSQNHVIRRVTLQGEVTTYAGSGLAGSRDDSAAKAEFRVPTGLAFDAQGHLYIADRMNHRIRRVTRDGQVRSLAGNGRPGQQDGFGEAAALNYPYDLVVGREGQIYVADYSNHAIRVLRPKLVQSSRDTLSRLAIAR